MEFYLPVYQRDDKTRTDSRWIRIYTFP